MLRHKPGDSPSLLTGAALGIIAGLVYGKFVAQASAAGPSTQPSDPSCNLSYVGFGAYASYDSTSPYQLPLADYMCSGVTWVGIIQARWGKRVPFWSGSNATIFETEELHLACVYSPVLATHPMPNPVGGVRIIKGDDANWPLDSYNDADPQSSSASLQRYSSYGYDPITRLSLAPETAQGAEGPWGLVAAGLWGYTGEDKITVECPAAHHIVGLRAASATLGGINFLQLICAPDCWDGGGPPPPDECWADGGTLTGNTCHGVTHLGPGALGAYPSPGESVPPGRQPLIQAACASGQYIANFTVRAATRTNSSGASESVISYLQASCSDGAELEPVTVSLEASSDYTWSKQSAEAVLSPPDIYQNSTMGMADEPRSRYIGIWYSNQAPDADVLQSVFYFNAQGEDPSDAYTGVTGTLLKGYWAQAYNGGIMFFDIIASPDQTAADNATQDCNGGGNQSLCAWSPSPDPNEGPLQVPPPAPGNTINAATLRPDQYFLNVILSIVYSGAVPNQPLPASVLNALAAVMAEILQVNPSAVFIGEIPGTSFGRRLAQTGQAHLLSMTANTQSAPITLPAAANTIALAVKSGGISTRLAAKGVPGVTTTLVSMQTESAANLAPPPPPITTEAPPTAYGHQLDGGGIAGIVIGSIVFVAIVTGAVAGFLFLQRGKVRRARQEAATRWTDSSSAGDGHGSAHK
ncbi:hypothetical protein WJX73_001416 [Symbiochloris irregularis]|uniref:Uncharacterized protein n=1 Tax=Symbiochloris irregularis TaxID=706552 RepID=A0AAW1NME3_9CHLO